MSSELPITLYPSRLRLAVLALACAMFVAAGTALLADGERVGWFGVGFFGPCMLIFIVQLWPGLSALTIDEDGFVVRIVGREQRVPWRDVRGFRVARTAGTRLVGRSVYYALADSEGMLPDTYGRRAKELAALLEHWRERALEDQSVRR